MGKVLNPGVFAPSVFQDADGVRHAADDLAGLVEKVAGYRVRNKRPMGHPLEEIVAYICEKHPMACQDIPAGAVPMPAPEPLPSGRLLSVSAEQGRSALTQRVVSWLRATYRRAGSDTYGYVNADEQLSRVGNCRECKHNLDWQSGCVGCAATVNQLSAAIRRGRDLDESEKLGGCELYGTDLRVDVVLKQPPIAAAPEWCWKRGNGSAS